MSARVDQANRTSDERGFTLIEVLIAMVIVTILTAVAIGSFQSSKESAKRNAVTTYAAELRIAIETFDADWPAFAGGPDGGDPLMNRVGPGPLTQNVADARQNLSTRELQDLVDDWPTNPYTGNNAPLYLGNCPAPSMALVGNVYVCRQAGGLLRIVAIADQGGAPVYAFDETA